MLRKLLFFTVFIILSNTLLAQNMRKYIKVKVAEASLSAGFGLYDNPVWGLGPNIHYMIGVGRNEQKFKIGLGIREFSILLKTVNMKPVMKII